ncbi:MAG: hypothetical protein FWB88_05725 [Defluviitaleaceae bacterium]|nr:hypothetical protein [Defluviitaleaceae bacterium]MCL2240625.1 hypothetical protein [Defluviitaleaceae bacterium]
MFDLFNDNRELFEKLDDTKKSLHKTQKQRKRKKKNGKKTKELDKKIAKLTKKYKKLKKATKGKSSRSVWDKVIVGSSPIVVNRVFDLIEVSIKSRAKK